MKIYTRAGDHGETSLFGGYRVPKNEPRIDAYGTVDELNSAVGVVRAHWPRSPIDHWLATVQNDLFDLGAHLAAPSEPERFPGVPVERIGIMEGWIDEMESSLEPLKNFILPGGSVPAAHLHLARTICRRAERLVVGLPDPTAGTGNALVYLNRLSDFLFVAARFANVKSGTPDVIWKR